jgi:hypothetical protein
MLHGRQPITGGNVACLQYLSFNCFRGKYQRHHPVNQHLNLYTFCPGPSYPIADVAVVQTLLHGFAVAIQLPSVYRGRPMPSFYCDQPGREFFFPNQYVHCGIMDSSDWLLNVISYKTRTWVGAHVCLQWAT